ncbi:zwei Ig domain protein zig-8 isoform X3 [Drosophila biarmipes]|uniref:zwei Ig domain protein zig-8 isoform X3 n=1 Tax=Drosophila biarmipes TaxID=125945 RepID=UPI0021CC68FB|nr:zwei Ig domain protein zig-8 isoform X3 [Drosophila biarmipes]
MTGELSEIPLPFYSIVTKIVSWMRKRDLHILTTNIYTYTGDQRFSVIHPPSSEDWDLKIDYAQPRDSGVYECQVNTEPKINLPIVLEITADNDFHDLKTEKKFYDLKAARAKILGSTEIHVKRDSTIALACSVNMHASSVIWYHGSSIIDFDSLRGGISLETEKTEIGTTSRLMLTRASLRDSGNYTCVPNGAIPASVRVHVLTGEQPAAMQTSAAIGNRAYTAMITIISVKVLLYISSLKEHMYRRER